MAKRCFCVTILLTLASIALAGMPMPNAVPYVPAATVNRHTAGNSLSSIFGSIASMFPQIPSILPMILAVSLGALLGPMLGSALFFREGQKRGMPSFSPAILDTVTDVMEKVIKALDAVEKKY